MLGFFLRKKKKKRKTEPSVELADEKSHDDRRLKKFSAAMEPGTFLDLSRLLIEDKKKNWGGGDDEVGNVESSTRVACVIEMKKKMYR